jgi:hypothetical protein
LARCWANSALQSTQGDENIIQIHVGVRFLTVKHYSVAKMLGFVCASRPVLPHSAPSPPAHSSRLQPSTSVACHQCIAIGNPAHIDPDPDLRQGFSVVVFDALTDPFRRAWNSSHPNSRLPTRLHNHEIHENQHPSPNEQTKTSDAVKCSRF